MGAPITDIGPTQLDSFFSSTIKNYKTTIKENFIKYRPEIEHFMQGAERDEGSYMVAYPVSYGFNNTTTFFDGMQKISTDIQETALIAQYFWKNIYSAVAIAETDARANSGKAKIFDLMMTRIKQAEKSINDVVSQEFYGDGTNYAFKTFIGVAAGVSQTPTVDPASGPVGGIPAATNTWWQNASVSLGSWAANGVNGTSTDSWFGLYNTLTDGSMVYPDIILSDQATYQYYNNSLVKQERIIQPSPDGATLNVGRMVYGPNNTPWYWSRMCPTGTAYMLNRSDMGFVVDPTWFMEWGPPKSWPDQLALVRILKLRLFMKYTRRMFLGVAYAITA